MSVNKKGKKGYEKALAIFGLVAGFAVILLIVWHFFGDEVMTILKLLQAGDEEAMEAYLSGQGMWKGYALVFFMSVLQVVSIFVPGLIIQVSAGVIYGWLKAFVLTYFGFVFGNVMVFYLARKLGRQVMDILEIDKRGGWLTDKINNYSPVFVLALAYLVPGIPNGFVPYFASRLDIRGKWFAAAVSMSSWIQILCNCVAGHYLIRGDTLAVVLAFGIQIALIILITYKRDFFLGLSNRNKK